MGRIVVRVAPNLGEDPGCRGDLVGQIEDINGHLLFEHVAANFEAVSGFGVEVQPGGSAERVIGVEVKMRIETAKLDGVRARGQRDDAGMSGAFGGEAVDFDRPKVEKIGEKIAALRVHGALERGLAGAGGGSDRRRGDMMAGGEDRDEEKRNDGKKFHGDGSGGGQRGRRARWVGRMQPRRVNANASMERPAAASNKMVNQKYPGSAERSNLRRLRP